MDACEAMQIMMSRIYNLDPVNASRIIGYILMQDQGEKEMIRLALGPDALLLSSVNQVKACLGLLSPKSLNPLCNSVRPNTFLPPNSPRILPPSDGSFQYGYISNPSSPAARPMSYAAVLNGSTSSNNVNGVTRDSGSPRLHSYGGNELSDEFLSGGGSAIMRPSGRSDSLIFPLSDVGPGGRSPHHPHPFHRRSHSVNDAVLLSHGGGGGGDELGFPSGDASRFDEYMRIRALQQQRFGAHHPLPNYSNFLNENQRNDFSPVGMGTAMAASSSRQIYMTFPADSTFKEEDVTAYFSMFGPVQDVRIPYQQQRMYGFITFVYPETVTLILGKGNPHYVCDSRVLVKPYKDKGKALDKKQFQQQYQNLERGECSSSLSPSATDSKELFDPPIESRMLFDRQEMLRRQLEHEVELQHAIELQGRRMENLQLMDLRYQQHNNRFFPGFPAAGVSVSSPRQPLLIENIVASSGRANSNVLRELDGWQESSEAVEVDGENSVLEETESSSYNVSNGNRSQHVNDDDSYLPESLEHLLPDTLFASPTKPDVEH